MSNPRYWLIPPEQYAALSQEFQFDFDPCPYPRPEGFDGLTVDWGNMNWVNPPFRRTEGNEVGPTAFVHKAIEQAEKGRSSVLILPVQSYVPLLLEAGAELRSAGRTRFLEVDTKAPLPSPSPTIYAILRGDT